jgi:hypothetical protein
MPVDERGEVHRRQPSPRMLSMPAIMMAAMSRAMVRVVAGRMVAP